MLCEGCGQHMTLEYIEWDEDEHAFNWLMMCPNYQSAFMEFLHNDITEFDQLGTYPCERLYEFPLYYQLV